MCEEYKLLRGKNQFNQIKRAERILIRRLKINNFPESDILF